MNDSPKFSRRVFLDGCLASVPVAAALAGVAHAEEPVVRAQIAVQDRERFRILQLTDLHYVTDQPEVSKEKTNELIRELLASTKPDLVMITGDLWADNKDGLGVQQMHEAIAGFDSWGLPWAYTWGNHDKLDDFSVGHKAFAEGKNSLYRGVATNGNYAIDLATADAKCIAQLVCLNTNTKGLGDEQRAWLRELAQTDPETAPRLAFFHIPLKQYADIWDSGAASGIKGEAVCLEEENGSSLAALKEAGVKACFCGHDHVNDYSGVADGIELVYGRATGGYGADRVDKGGKVIDFNGKTGEYRWYSVTRKEAQWHPSPGSRVEIPK